MNRPERRPLILSPIFAAVTIVAWAFVAPPAIEAQSPLKGDANTVRVRTDAALRLAVLGAKPGDRIELEAGVYRGGLHFANLHGSRDKPIVITAADPQRPPTIRGGHNCLHLANPAHVHLEHLVLSGASINGLNIDDGGDFNTPAQGIVLRNLVIRDIGAGGNHDGIKLSGLADFLITGCTVQRWGAGGSGIDMVGCHAGIIEDCTFEHNQWTNGNGVQTKGGSSGIVIRRCRFKDAGERAINIGGSTGLRYFRPLGVKYEARDITIERNTFVGSRAAVAFVNTDGATVRFNTIYRPRRWIVRILQETRDPGFVPSRNGVFADNLIVFHWGEVVQPINVGAATAPQTFTFARNWWYCANQLDQSRPQLPVAEKDGVYGRDPKLVAPDHGEFGVAEDSEAKGVGAHAE